MHVSSKQKGIHSANRRSNKHKKRKHTGVWGRKFEDKFTEQLKHINQWFLSVSNSGPNTNG